MQCICKLFDHFGNGLIRTIDPEAENLGIVTSFIFLSHVLSELWPKKCNFGKGRLICILLKTLKGAYVA